MGSWNDDNITNSSRGGSCTELADNHVESSILHNGEVLVGCGDEINIWTVVMELSPSDTIVRTPRPAFDVLSCCKNLDLVFTSRFEEWNHSWNEETVVIGDWLNSASDVELHSGSEGNSTIIFRFQVG